jgi:hypothetical protein
MSNQLLKLAEKFEHKIAQNVAIPTLPISNDPKTKAIVMGASEVYAILNYYFQTNNYEPGMTYDQFNQLKTADNLAAELKKAAPTLQSACSKLLALLK